MSDSMPNIHYLPTLSRENWEGPMGYVHTIYENICKGNMTTGDGEPKVKPANFYLCGWKNLKTAETKISIDSETFIPKAFSGIHVLDHRILELLTKEGKFSIIDSYLDLCKTNSILSFDHSGGEFQDVGTAESVLDAEKLFR